MQLRNKYGSTLGDISFDNLIGIKGLGAYRLSFQLNVSVKSKPQDKTIYFEQIKGQVNLGSITIGTANTQGFEIIEFFDFAQDNKILHLYIDLARAQLDAIEEVRDGGDLNLTLFLYALCREDNSIYTFSDNLDFKLNQRTWTDALAQSGYSKYLTFEVPFPVAIDSQLGSAISYMEKAKDSFFRGEYETTVSHCRNALENLHSHSSLQNKMDKATAVP